MAEVSVKQRGAALWVTIDREPRRNALDGATLAALDEALTRAEGDAAVRAVVITGAGERVFCSGADLADAGGGDVPGPLRYARLLQRMRAFPKPIIARLGGHCLAGGMGLVLAADLAIAREGVTLGTPEVKVGLWPMMVSRLLLEQVPRKRAMEMMITGRRLTAAEAVDAGILTRVASAQGLDADVDEAVAAIEAAAPLAIAQGKAALIETERLPTDEALERLHQALVVLMGTEDAAEGLSAFFEKRAPAWKGR
jgi:enoyl-CoA hydratase/carnithine racemase